MLERIAAASAARPGRQLLFLESWDESDWADRTHVARADLDAISEDRPIVARRVCGHRAVVNSAALGLLASRWSGRGIDGASGHVIEEPALELDELFPPDAREGAAALAAAARACFALGITTASDFLRPRALAIYAAPERPPTPRITGWVLPECLTDRGEVIGDPGESDRFVVRGMKLFCDGTIGGRTAAVFEDYADAPGVRGELLLAPAVLRTLVRRAHDAGRAVAMHTIGDRAIATALDVLDDLPRREVALRGHRLEHVELPRREDIARMARLAVRPCVQPNFLQWAGRGGAYETALGPARLRRMNPFRTLLEAGCRPFFGSDGMPASPVAGIRWAMEHPVAEERLSLDEAIRLYTEEAATPGRPAEGRIEPGAIADLVALDDRPDRLPAPGFADLTWLGGEIVHRRALEANATP